MHCLFKGQRWPERLTRGICSDSRCTETVFNIKHNRKSHTLSTWIVYPDAAWQYSPSFIFNHILAFYEELEINVSLEAKSAYIKWFMLDQVALWERHKKYAFSSAKTYWITAPTGTLILMHIWGTLYLFGRQLHQDDLLLQRLTHTLLYSM